MQPSNKGNKITSEQSEQHHGIDWCSNHEEYHVLQISFHVSSTLVNLRHLSSVLAISPQISRTLVNPCQFSSTLIFFPTIHNSRQLSLSLVNLRQLSSKEDAR